MRESTALWVVVGAMLVVSQAMAADIGVTGKKLIIVDKTAAASRAKIVYVSKDQGAGITKGAGTDTSDIDAQFDYFYGGAGSVMGSFVIPAGANNGTDGWKVNKTTVAKYINKPAPAGPTGVKVAVIKPGKLLKVVGKNLGDTPIDIVTAGGPGAGTVETISTVNNGGDTNRHCTSFPTCSFKVIAAGTGAKLVCKNGIAGTCPVPATTTTSTVTTTSTSNSTTSSTSSSTTTSTSSSTSTTAAPTCNDGIQNQDETDVDCGGAICPNCGPGDSCLVGADCDSSVCTGLICQAATCSDGVQNGTETDVDCGGSCPANCSLGEGCSAGNDCISGTCIGGECTCANQAFTFNIVSNNGGSFDPAEWPSGTVQATQSAECSVRANRPGGNIDNLAGSGLFNVNSFSGFSNCFGSGGEAGTGCTVLSCPPAGIGDCDTGTVGRPNCSAALNGSGSARLVVQCLQ